MAQHSKPLAPVIYCLLLGPSGVGKTRLGRAWATLLNIDFCDLDTAITSQARRPATEILMNQGLAHFFELSLALIQQEHQRPQSVVLAVGAGTQLAAQGQLHLLNWPHLYLDADPAWLWAQNQQYRQDPRSFENFVAVEFHSWRQQLASHAQHRLNITGQELTSQLQQVQQIFNPDPGLQESPIVPD